MTQSIENKVKEIVVDQLGLASEDVQTDTELSADLGTDVLDVIDLVLAIEDEFGVDITDEDAEKFKNVGDIVAFISNRAN